MAFRLLHTETHKSWTAGEVKRFISTVAKAEQCEITGRYKIGSYREDFTAALLSIYTGSDWEWAKISGCCQSDWNIIYYPKEKYTDEDIKMFETGYINTGTEWIIHDGDYIPETLDDICGYSMYCYTNNPIKEIAESEGVSADNVVLYKCEMRYMLVYTRV